MHLSLKDVWLDYFINKQNLINELRSGDELILNGDECLTRNGKSVLKFSKHFVKQIDKMKAKNYDLKHAVVNFIVYWTKEDTEQEIKIILPELLIVRI